MPDGTWRDSYGSRAGSLAELLPTELSDFRLVSRSNSEFSISNGTIEKIDSAMYGLEP